MPKLNWMSPLYFEVLELFSERELFELESFDEREFFEEERERECEREFLAFLERVDFLELLLSELEVSKRLEKIESPESEEGRA